MEYLPSPATGFIMGLLYFHELLKTGLQNVAARRKPYDKS